MLSPFASNIICFFRPVNYLLSGDKMASKIYDKTFSEVLEPELIKLGFKKVRLDHCMRPEYLYQKNRLWFSTSWDWRDGYFDANLGRLFWFKDVMPRVVVIGDYSSYDREIKKDSIRSEGDIQKTLSRIAETLSSAMAKYEAYYTEIFQSFRVSRGQRPGINIDEFIGKEVDEESLRQYLTK
jgi:hypothetical protein